MAARELLFKPKERKYAKCWMNFGVMYWVIYRYCVLQKLVRFSRSNFKSVKAIDMKTQIRLLSLIAATAVTSSFSHAAITVENYDTGSDANIAISTGGTDVTADFTTDAASNSYFLVSASTRNGGRLLSDFTLSLGGGSAVDMTQLAFVNNGGDNSLVSIWGLAVSNVTASQSVVVNATSDGTDEYNFAILQLSAANAIQLADADGSAYNDDRALSVDIGAGDFVFSSVVRRNPTQFPSDPTTANIGAFDSNILVDANSLIPSTGGANIRRNYWLDPTSGTDVSFQYSNHEGSAAVVLTAVPEPSTYALLAGCLALVGVMVRRRRLS